MMPEKEESSAALKLTREPRSKDVHSELTGFRGILARSIFPRCNGFESKLRIPY
jgi:hypothetical protein